MGTRTPITLLVIVLTICLAAGPAPALTITRNFTGGTQPANAVGGGSLSSVFNAAADIWEAAILDSHAITINYSWAPLNVLAEAEVFSPVPFPTAIIEFDNDQSTVWYIDSTPTDNSEWTTFNEEFDNLGGGSINTQNKFTGGTGGVVGRYDLLTVAVHEIGHAMGIISFPTPLDDPTEITAPRPKAGTEIFTTATGGGHIDSVFHPDANLISTVPLSQRKLLTDVDILLAAQRSGFDPILLNIGPSPDLGDMNQDGNVTLLDVPIFVEALTDEASYESLNLPYTLLEVGDINLDGIFDLGDAAPFSALFGGSASVGASASASASAAAAPEPSSLLLALLASLAIASIRSRPAR